MMHYIARESATLYIIRRVRDNHVCQEIAKDRMTLNDVVGIARLMDHAYEHGVRETLGRVQSRLTDITLRFEAEQEPLADQPGSA
jgi:division protein CdvB (Snf7/Vps24/ESCRT-III family)